MNILFISNDLIAGNLAYLLKKEGHKVKLYIHYKQHKENFQNLVEKVNNWRRELPWVGKNGLIIFDDIGWGKEQEELRKRGFSVFGGSRLGDKLETDREWAQGIFAKYGMKIEPVFDFKNISEAIKFVKRHPYAWVIKQNDHASKWINFVSKFEDGRDVLNMLENYKRTVKDEVKKISLQKKIDGIELGCARYFNGKDWVGPIEMNIEHKQFFPDDFGPTTSEMGTLAWYDENEKENRLFHETIGRLKPYLQKIDFRGDINLNCIINEDGAFPLEATPRFGSPIIHLHSEIHVSPWGEFLKAVATGRHYKLRYHKGYGIIVLVTVPPFPYVKKLPGNSPYGIDINFSPQFKKSDRKHVHFEEVSQKSNSDQLYISDHRGYILYVTSMG